jgi:hypothetical protein
MSLPPDQSFLMAMALRLPCDENDEAHPVRSRHTFANSQGGRYARPVTDYPIAERPHGNAFGKNSCATRRGQENVGIQFLSLRQHCRH